MANTNINLNLTAKQVKTLATAIESTDYDNGYAALKGQLSPANKAKLRAQSDEEGFIRDSDLIWSIINTVNPDDTGLAL